MFTLCALNHQIKTFCRIHLSYLQQCYILVRFLMFFITIGW